MKCCVATCHVSTAWHLLLKARAEVGLRPRCSALCGGPKRHGQSVRRLHPEKNKQGRSGFQESVAHRCRTAQRSYLVLLLAKSHVESSRHARLLLIAFSSVFDTIQLRLRIKLLFILNLTGCTKYNEGQ